MKANANIKYVFHELLEQSSEKKLKKHTEAHFSHF
jgi:hypothetical protein